MFIKIFIKRSQPCASVRHFDARFRSFVSQSVASVFSAEVRRVEIMRRLSHIFGWTWWIKEKLNFAAHVRKICFTICAPILNVDIRCKTRLLRIDLHLVAREILFYYRVCFPTNDVLISLVDQITMNIDFQFTCISPGPDDIWQRTICNHQLCNHIVDGNIIHNPQWIFSFSSKNAFLVAIK